MAVWQRYLDDDVLVFGLNPDGPLHAELDVFIEAFGITFPILVEAASVRTVYNQPSGLSPFPLDYIIDQQGRIAYINTEYDPNAMTAMIDELLLSESAVEGRPPLAKRRLWASPTPFNPRTTIKYSVAGQSPVFLKIFDISGALVRNLINGKTQGPGWFSIDWDGLDQAGRAVGSGVYLYRFETRDHTETRRLTLIR
jgi:hypothetical protein